MKLQEEYSKRHNLSFKPIYHVTQANLVLKLRGRPQVILEIKWDAAHNRPGYYIFSFLSPNHNGYLDGNYFLEIDDPHYYQYDEYAHFIMRWVKNLNFEPIRFVQIRLAIWEMFVYCFDGWVAEHNLEDMIFPTNDLLLSDAERLKTIDNFLQYMEKNNPLVYDIYNSEFMKYEFDYADWLAELIELHASKEEV